MSPCAVGGLRPSRSDGVGLDRNRGANRTLHHPILLAKLFGVWSISTIALGGTWFFQPTEARLGTSFEQNANLTREDPIDALGYEVEAQARGGYFGQRFQIFGRLGAFVERYPGNEELDSENLFMGLRSAFSATELDQLGLDVLFTRDTSRFSELTTTGNIIGNVPRNEIRISPRWQRRLTERSSIGVEYQYTKTSFSQDSSDLVDSEQQDIGASYSYQVSERLTLGAQFGATSFDPDNDESFTGYDLWSGMDYAFSETLRGKLAIGWGQVDSDTGVGAEQTSTTTAGALYGFSLTKIDERSRFSLSVSRNAVPTGSGEPLVQENVSLGYGYQVSPRLGVAIPISVFRNQTLDIGSADRDDETRIYFTMEPQLTWRVAERLLLNLAYRYQYEYLDTRGTSTEGNSVFLSLSYSWPRPISAVSQ